MFSLSYKKASNQNGLRGKSQKHCKTTIWRTGTSHVGLLNKEDKHAYHHSIKQKNQKTACMSSSNNDLELDPLDVWQTWKVAKSKTLRSVFLQIDRTVIHQQLNQTELFKSFDQAYYPMIVMILTSTYI